MLEREILVEVGDDGRVAWDEGTLVHPDPARACRCIAAAARGFPPRTMLTLIGKYERPSRSEKRLHLEHVRVHRSVRSRAHDAFATWDRLRSFGPSPRLEAAREELDRLLLDLAGDPDEQAQALRSRVAVLAGDFRRALEGFPRLLHEGSPEIERDLAAIYLALVEAGLDPTPTAADRERLVRRVWAPYEHSNGPQADVVDAWSFWVHPLQRAAHRGLRDRAPFPWHFGGPSVEPDFDVLAPWIDARFDALATPEERHVLSQLRSLDDDARREWYARVLANDEARHERAYDAMVADFDGGPSGLDSPPDDVGVTWEEAHTTLPARWCAFAIGRGGARDFRVPRPDTVGESLGELMRERRPARRQAFVLALDAAAILSRVAPELTPAVADVVFVAAELTRGRALVRLERGRGCLLDAPEGRFGPWRVVEGDFEALIERLGERDRPLARMALERADLAQPVLSPRCYLIVEAHFGDSEPERWVEHPRYGRGLVVGSTPGPRGPKLLIEFEGVGRKQLLHTFVKEAPKRG